MNELAEHCQRMADRTTDTDQSFLEIAAGIVTTGQNELRLVNAPDLGWVMLGTVHGLPLFSYILTH